MKSPSTFGETVLDAKNEIPLQATETLYPLWPLLGKRQGEDLERTMVGKTVEISFDESVDLSGIGIWGCFGKTLNPGPKGDDKLMRHLNPKVSGEAQEGDAICAW